MAGRFKIILSCVEYSLLLTSATLSAQILQDKTTMNLVKEDIEYIYNFQFDSARKVYNNIIQSYPEHPIVFLLRGMMRYWENYPLLYTNPSRNSFEEDLHQCIKLSEKNKNPDYEAEYLLANLCARGMLLQFYDDNGMITEIIPLTISTYSYLMRSFDFASVCTDLYYFTGVYNYYREAYPRFYPVYKSLAIMFPHGNMESGLKELQTAALNSIVLRAESSFLLSHIYLNFENRYTEALSYCKTLHDHYPENVLYHAIYIKNLLLMKQYDEAEKLLIISPEEAENSYFKAQLIIFKGVLQEKKYFDNKVAQEYYIEGIREISIFGKYADEYAAYGYYGLGRISEANGEKRASQTYRKTAIKLGDSMKDNFDK
jgi:hypothetical protein